MLCECRRVCGHARRWSSKSGAAWTGRCEDVARKSRSVTIGYGDAEGYERTSVEVRDAAHAHDRRLHQRGVMPVVGVAQQPVQVRNHDAGGVSTTVGAFMQSALPVAGFAIIEAADLDEAISLVSGTPCAVAQGVVEVWPLQD